MDKLTFRKKTNIFHSNSSEIQSVCITAMFISLTIIAKYFGQYIPIQGNSLEIELVVYTIGLLVIFKWKYKIIFLLLCPFLWIMLKVAALNFFQVVIEYFIPEYFFVIIPLSFIYLQRFGKISVIINLCIILIVVYSFKCLCHTIAGYLWWLPPQKYLPITWKNIIPSLIFNAQFIGTNLLFQLPISTFIFYLIFSNKFFSNYYLKINIKKRKIK
ncbi:MAG: hypothetical protein ACRDCG_02065 [Mycoplasmoidaceae bacterium]